MPVSRFRTASTSADSPISVIVQGLIERVTNWVRQKADPREAVRHALRSASQWTADSTGDVTIRSTGANPLDMHCQVLAVRHDSFIITLPVIGRETQKLGTNALMEIMLPGPKEQRMIGGCRVVNRVHPPSLLSHDASRSPHLRGPARRAARR